jgi:hypothetical protein
MTDLLHGSEIRGYIGMNGNHELCFFPTARAEGVPIPESYHSHDEVFALLNAINHATARRITFDKLDALDAPRRCRECGCIEIIACFRSSDHASACAWAAPDLCTACIEDAHSDWVHPPRAITDQQHKQLAGM